MKKKFLVSLLLLSSLLISACGKENPDGTKEPGITENVESETGETTEAEGN